jgi:hypothetical protein
MSRTGLQSGCWSGDLRRGFLVSGACKAAMAGLTSSSGSASRFRSSTSAAAASRSVPVVLRLPADQHSVRFARNFPPPRIWCWWAGCGVTRGGMPGAAPGRLAYPATQADHRLGTAGDRVLKKLCRTVRTAAFALPSRPPGRPRRPARRADGRPHGPTAARRTHSRCLCARHSDGCRACAAPAAVATA